MRIGEKELQQIEELAAKGMSRKGIEGVLGLGDGLIRRYWAKGENQRGVGKKVYLALLRGYARLERELLKVIWAAIRGQKLEGSERFPNWQAAMRMLEAINLEWARASERKDKDVEPYKAPQELKIKVIPTRKIEDFGFGEDENEDEEKEGVVSECA